MKRDYILIASGFLLTVLGITVMAGWLYQMPMLTSIKPGYINMVFNSSLSFTLIGIALLMLNSFNSARSHKIVSLIGISIFFFAMIIVSQPLFNYNIGIDQFFVKVTVADQNPYPGRMAVNTSLCFMFAALAISLMPYTKYKAVCIINLTCTLLIYLMGLIALFGYLLDMSFLYSWYQYSQMAIHTSIGMLLIAAGLAAALRHLGCYEVLFRDREDKKIILFCIVSFLTVSFIVGICCFSIAYNDAKQLLEAHLVQSSRNRLQIFEEEVNRSLKSTLVLASIIKKELIQNTSGILNDVLNDKLNHFSEIKVFDSENKLMASTSDKFSHPDLILPITLPHHAALIWENGWYIRYQIDFLDGLHYLGKMEVVWPLTGVNYLFSRFEGVGKTGEIIVCGTSNFTEAHCFPSRLNPKPFTIDLKTSPPPLIINGLKGKTSLNMGYDYRRKQVIAFHSPIGATGLGMTNKVDAEELYSPIREQLDRMVIIIILCIIAYIIFIYSQIRPLLQRVINSEIQANEKSTLLLESEKRFRTIMQYAPDGMAIISIDKKIIDANYQFAKLLGYQLDVIKSKDFMQLVFDEDYENLMEGLDQLQTNVVSGFHHEMRFKRKHESAIWLNVSASLVKNNRAEPLYFIAHFVDVSERRTIDSVKDGLISVVSHELRTPLTSINGSLRLITSGVLGHVDEDKMEMLNIAYNNCERLIRLVNDILDIEKMEMGKMIFKMEKCNLLELVSEAVRSMDAFAQKFKVKLISVLPTQPVFIVADHDRIMQVLINLISNAIKFSPSNTTVKVMLSIDQLNIVKVLVVDQGMGVPEEYKHKLFGKFNQIDTSSTRKTEGTGLGLSISKALIENMHGVIGFESEYKKGSTFYFSFPAHLEHELTPSVCPLTDLPIVYLCLRSPYLNDIMMKLLEAMPCHAYSFVSIDEVAESFRINHVKLFITDCSIDTVKNTFQANTIMSELAKKLSIILIDYDLLPHYFNQVDLTLSIVKYIHSNDEQAILQAITGFMTHYLNLHDKEIYNETDLT